MNNWYEKLIKIDFLLSKIISLIIFKNAQFLHFIELLYLCIFVHIVIIFVYVRENLPKLLVFIFVIPRLLFLLRLKHFDLRISLGGIHKGGHLKSSQPKLSIAHDFFQFFVISQVKCFQDSLIDPLPKFVQQILSFLLSSPFLLLLD